MIKILVSTLFMFVFATLVFLAPEWWMRTASAAMFILNAVALWIDVDNYVAKRLEEKQVDKQ